jgi:ABC-2 type transport system ATP-binding protein
VLEVNIRAAGYTENKGTIQNIAFSVGSGELVALIGANGAGKSTTIKAILGLLPYVDGTISIQHGGYAYVPEQPTYYDYLTVWEHMELLAAAKALDAGWKKHAAQLLHIFRMENSKHDYISQFSKGMKQKVMLMLAFLAKPDFYIIDEPFLGLDPTAIRDFLALLQKERERGAGVLLCTHVLDTAERICDRFVLVSNGHMFANGSLTNIQQLSNMPGAPLIDCFDAIVRGKQHV